MCVSFSLFLRAVAVVSLYLGFGGERQIEPSGGSAVSLRCAAVEQLYQAQRMIGGIGNVLLSTYSQTENGEDPLVSLVNL